MVDKLFPNLETPRLKLREITIDDAAWYLYYYNEWSIIEANCQPGPVDIIQAKEDLTYFCTDLCKFGHGYRWGIELKGKEGLIGTCGFHNWEKASHRTNVGYDLDPLHRGQGFMAEAMEAIIELAFNGLDIHRIEAIASEDNVNSIRLLQRLGFVNEGVLRGYTFFEGRYKNAVMYSLIKEDRQLD